MRTSPLPVILTFLLASPLAAQSQHALLRHGDLVTGLPVSNLRSGAIDDGGGWSALCDLGGIHALVRDGAPLIVQGDPLPGSGADIGNIQAVSGSGANESSILLLVNFVPPRANALSALVRGGVVHLQSDEPANVVGLPPTAICRHIETVAAMGDDTVLAIARIDDLKRALLRFEFAPDGSVLTREAVLQTGQVLPDGSVVRSIPALRSLGMDRNGGWVLRALVEGGGARLVSDQGVVIGTGSPAPLAGRTVLDVLPSYDRNDSGGLAVGLVIDGTPAGVHALFVNGSLVAQQGDPLATSTPNRLRDIGGVRLGNSGDVYWHAMVNGSNEHFGALMRNQKPVIEAGVTVVDGTVVSRFSDPIHNFEISPSGRFLLAGVLLGTRAALVQADFGAAVPLPGCTPNPGSLRLEDGLVLAGHTIRLELDGPAPLGAVGSLHFSTAPAVPGSECGLMTPFGELLIDPGQRIGIVPAGIALGGPLHVDIAIPPLAALVDLSVYVQGGYQGGGVMLTNALRLDIGAP